MPSILFSPDGRYLVATDSSAISVSDLYTAEIKTLQQGDSRYKSNVPGLPDWEQFTAAAYQQIMRRQIKPIKRLLPTYSVRMMGTAFSHDGTLLAVGNGEKGIIWVWNMQSGELLQTLVNSDSPVCYLVFTSDGQRLISVSADKKVQVWNTLTGQAISSFVINLANLIAQYVLSPDGTLLAVCDYGIRGEDGLVRVWNVVSGESSFTRDVFRPITMLAFSPDSGLLAEANLERTVVLRDMQTLQPKWSLEHPHPVRVVAFNPEATRLVTGSSADDGTITVWNTQTGQALDTIIGHTHYIMSTIFNPDGTLLASGDYGGSIRLWDMDMGQSIGTLDGHTRWMDLAFSADGTLLISTSDDGTIRLWAIDL